MPLIANGFFAKARRQAQSNVAAMRETALPVIATSSTCAFTLRDEYPHLLDVDNQDLRDRVELATRWIWRQLDAGRTLPLRPPLKVVYHTPCHMEKMGWSLYTLELLRLIPGLQLEVLDSQCCGIAGTYGFKSENYPLLRPSAHRCSGKLRRAVPTGDHRLRNLQMANRDVHQQTL